MIPLKSKTDIQAMAQAGKILREILEKLAKEVREKISTASLNEQAEKLIKEKDVTSAFKNYKGKKGPYPASLCVSLNDEVVHGIPKTDVLLKNGDIVSLDLGIWHKNLCVDSALTVPVGHITEQAKHLITTTKQALAIGISKVRDGAFVADISEAIQKYVKSQDFSAVRALVGHGVGYSVHEEPQIPNFWDKKSLKNNRGPRLKTGMTLAIEPMITAGGWRVYYKDDGWTVATKDGSLSAHFEHTVAVTKNGCIVLT